MRASKLSKVYVTLPQITRTSNQLIFFFHSPSPHPCNSPLPLFYISLFAHFHYLYPFRELLCGTERLRLFVLLCPFFLFPYETSQRKSDETQRGVQEGQAGVVRDAARTCHRDVSTAIVGVAHAISATNTLSTLARAFTQAEGIIPDMQLQEVNSGCTKGRLES